jgi:hypothetical protein
VRTSAGVFKTKNGIVPSFILGLRGTLLKDKNDKILAFFPDRDRQTVITASAADAGWVKDARGVKYDVLSDADVYTAEGMKPDYGTAFADIAPGMSVTLFYNDAGTVEAVYISTASSDKAVVAGTTLSGSALSDITGGDTGYAVYKNGVQVTLSDIRDYDVLTYDSASKVLRATDFRISGILEGCWPNVTSPSVVTVFGYEFKVMNGAAASFAGLSIGSRVTLLLTTDNQVAGVVTNVNLPSTAVGLVQSASASSLTVKLFNGLVLSGNPNLSDYAASQLAGELVTVSSHAVGQIHASRVSGKTEGNLDLVKMTLGTAPLSPAVRVYERAGKGPVVQIALGDITVQSVSGSKVRYSESDSAGRITTLLLDNVTGDRYTYGILQKNPPPTEQDVYWNPKVTIKNRKNPSGDAFYVTADQFENGDFGGVVISAGVDSGYSSMTASVIRLKSAENVRRSDFYTSGGKTYVRVGSMTLPIADNVECYNRLGNTWFKSLEDARAFSETLTVYYDRLPEEGGKVRVVAA